MSATAYPNLQSDGLAADLLAGKIGVIPSDTLYGLMCLASDKAAVERVYLARSRTKNKPCVVLAASLEQLLETTGLDRNSLLMAEKYWPGPVSVVVATNKGTMPHIHRGTGTIAFRVPSKPELLALLEKTGPIMAPSANPEGQAPATTIDEARAYFGDTIDFYVEGGTITGLQPSTVIKFTEDGLVETLRQGVVAITENGDVI